MFNIPGNLENLDKLKRDDPERITSTYQKVFGMPEGELVLIDLMDRFFEFKPVNNMTEAGAQSVIIYIKNRLLGVTEPKEQHQEIIDE